MQALRSSTGLMMVLLVGACTEPVAPRQAAPDFRCFAPPRLEPVIPAEILPILDQENVDCFAWQELIALGWPASDRAGIPNVAASPARFGDPAQVSPFVFQTYADVDDLFQPGAREPAPWEARPRARVPTSCAGDAEVERAVKAGAPVLSSTTEAGLPAPAWLTAQSGKPVYFEIRVNHDVYEYVSRERLYDAPAQLGVAQKAGVGIALPAGAGAYGHEGAVELKMAWLEVDPAVADRYATTTAVLREPSRCRVARMGLVGMHVSHKTPAAQQWTWATFEHEDNAPERVEVERGQAARAYTFYNPTCTPPGAPECQPNRKPECNAGSCDPMSRPVQVVREVSLPPEVRRINQAMKQLITTVSPRSVWQHYILVDVMWPGSAEVVPPGQVAPLPHGGAQPTALANVTMETYVQTGEARKSCLDCHATATVAPSIAEIAPTAATDYSFIFQRACDPGAPAGSCHPGSKPSAAR